MRSTKTLPKISLRGGGQYSAPGGALKKDQTKKAKTEEKSTEDRIRESILKGEVEGVESVGMLEIKEDEVTTKRLVSKEEVMKSQIEGNPMFEKMANMLEGDPQVVEEMMELLDKSNGNLFSVMTNPKFQKLAQKMMANPELMQMMSDPSVVKDAMKSAQQIGLTDQMGMTSSSSGDAQKDAAEFAKQATQAIKEGVTKVEKQSKGSVDLDDDMPELLRAKVDKLSDTLSRMSEEKGSVLDQMGVKKDFRNVREDKEKALRDQIEAARKTRADLFSASGEQSESPSDDLSALMQMSRDMPTPSSGGARVGESSNVNLQENLLYAGGFVLGVGGVLAGMSLALGLIETPAFMKDSPSPVPVASKAVNLTPGGAPKLKSVELNDDPF